jgi:hypothetical protein
MFPVLTGVENTAVVKFDPCSSFIPDGMNEQGKSQPFTFSKSKIICSSYFQEPEWTFLFTCFHFPAFAFRTINYC